MQCDDYVETQFEFDNETNIVDITITASNVYNWFSIGFPSPLLYYDKSIDLQNGYQIVYLNDGSDEVKEYNRLPNDQCDELLNISSCYVEQNEQNIFQNYTVINGSVKTIELQRKLKTTDIEDFEFMLNDYIECFPFLLTIAVGDSPTFNITYTYQSSYVYLYDMDLLSNS